MAVKLDNIDSISPDGTGQIVVTSDVNLVGMPAHVYRVNGVPLTTGQNQTPWLSNIDGAGYSLLNAGQVRIGAATGHSVTLWTTGINWNTDNVPRWSLGKQTNAAANLILSRIDDSESAQDTIFINRATGFVGLANSSPACQLDVAGDAQISGTVGIGTAPWVAPITITKSLAGGTPLIYATNFSSSGPASIQLNNDAGTAFRFGVRGSAEGGPANTCFLECSSDLTFFFGPSGSMTERMRITSAGNVGIGVQSPAYALHVAGDVNLSAGSVYRINGVPLSTGGAQTPWTSNIDAAQFQLNNIPRVNFVPPFGTASGNISINASALSVAASGSNTMLDLSSQFELRFSSPWMFINAWGSTGQIFNITNWTSSSVFQIVANGNVGIGVSPTRKLDVAGDVNFAGTAGIAGNTRITAAVGAPTSGVGLELSYNPNPDNFAMIQAYDRTAAAWRGVQIEGNGVIINNNSRANILLCASGGNVGIGTASPTGLLHVNSPSDNALIRIQSPAGSAPFISAVRGSQDWWFGPGLLGNDSWNILNATTAGYCLTINTNGNVGIGTTNPTARLQIDQTSGGWNLFLNQPIGTWGTAQSFQDHRFIQTSSAASDGNFKYFAVGAGGVSIGPNAPPPYGSSAALLVNGHVGIWTNNPEGPLHIAVSQGDWGASNCITLQNTGAGDIVSLRIRGTTYTGGDQTAICFVQNSASNWQSTMTFHVHNGSGLIEAMRISASGGLAIGPGAAAPQLGDLGVSRGDGSGAVWFPGGNYIYYNGSSWVFQPPLTVAAGSIPIYANGITHRGTRPRLNFSTGGSIFLAVDDVPANDWVSINYSYSPSDGRVKQNVRSLEGGLSVINQMHVVEAEFNGSAGTTAGTRTISCIAQELRPVLPEAVYARRGKLRPEDTEETDILTVDPYPVTFHSVLAIQQLDARLKKLEEKL